MAVGRRNRLELGQWWRRRRRWDYLSSRGTGAPSRRSDRTSGRPPRGYTDTGPTRGYTSPRRSPPGNTGRLQVERAEGRRAGEGMNTHEGAEAFTVTQSPGLMTH